MEIRQLRHFIAAVAAGNLRKASEDVHLSHPALSMSIKNLERDLGVELLIKNRRGVQMTHAGEQFLSAAHSILCQLDDLRASLLSTQDKPMGNVRLGVTYGTNNALAALLFRRLLECYPGVNLEVEEGNSTSLERLNDQNMLDLMLNYNQDEKIDQKCEPLYIEDLYLISAYDPALEEVDQIEGQELSNFAIVSSPGSYSMRRTIEQYAFNKGLKLDFLMDFQSAHSSLKIVEAGLAHSIASWDLIHDRVANKTISARRIVNPPMQRTVCLISSLREQRTPAIDAVIATIKCAIEEAMAKDLIRGQATVESQQL